VLCSVGILLTKKHVSLFPCHLPVNCYDNFDAAAPFGGYKQSGHGREKGEAGLDNWLETKTVITPLQGHKA